MSAAATAASGAVGAGSAGAAKVRILATAELTAAGVERLGRYGEVSYQPRTVTKRMLAGAKLIEVVAGFHVFITEADQIKGQAVFDKLPDLKLIGACRGAPVNVDLDQASARGIPVLNTPGRNAISVAELAVAFMISLARHIPQTVAILKSPEGGVMRIAKAFVGHVGMELSGKTVGLVGLGAVGGEVAKRVKAFGCRVVAFDPYVSPARVTELGVDMASLDRLMAEADFVSLHAAVTPETTGLIGAPQFALMKPTAYFINTARAALTDEDALLAALTAGKLAGAALDVFSKEPPPPDHPLLNLPNVLATPHIGGNTAEIAVHQTDIIVDDVVRWLEGKRPRNCVNPATVKNLAP